MRVYIADAVDHRLDEIVRCLYQEQRFVVLLEFILPPIERSDERYDVDAGCELLVRDGPRNRLGYAGGGCNQHDSRVLVHS